MVEPVGGVGIREFDRARAGVGGRRTLAPNEVWRGEACQPGVGREVVEVNPLEQCVRGVEPPRPRRPAVALQQVGEHRCVVVGRQGAHREFRHRRAQNVEQVGGGALGGLPSASECRTGERRPGRALKLGAVAVGTGGAIDLPSPSGLIRRKDGREARGGGVGSGTGCPAHTDPEGGPKEECQPPQDRLSAPSARPRHRAMPPRVASFGQQVGRARGGRKRCGDATSWSLLVEGLRRPIRRPQCGELAPSANASGSASRPSPARRAGSRFRARGCRPPPGRRSSATPA